MEQSPTFGYPYPDESDSNDVPRDMKNLALAIDTETSRQGALENRPAAGVRGREYLATTRKDPTDPSSTVTWNVLYRDNGSQWIQLNASAVLTYTPAFTAVPGETPSFTISVNNTLGVAEYQYKPGGLVWFNVHRLVTLTGTDGFAGVAVSLPASATTPAVISCGAQNDLARGFVDPTAQVASTYLNQANNGGKFHADGANYWWRLTGEYRIS